MDDVKIRAVSINDIEQLQKISKQTFADAFSSQNSAEDIQAYMFEAFSAEKLTSELTESRSVFYFAEVDNEVVGYLKLNSGESQTELKDEKAVEIERIYVLQSFQGRKIGQLLFEYAISVAKENNADYVWLGVWEENFKAIKFYQKNGFVEFDKHLFKLGSDVQTDIMMKLKLTA